MLPFYDSSVEEEEKAASEAAEVRKALQSSAAGKDGQPVEEWNYLENFFKRYNKVLLDVMGIERERERLAGQNGDLRSILKQCVATPLLTAPLPPSALASSLPRLLARALSLLTPFPPKSERRRYLDGISVNEDVINNPNPLLVVNHKTNIVMPAAYKQPPSTNTVVEGAHAVSIMARSL